MRMRGIKSVVTPDTLTLLSLLALFSCVPLPKRFAKSDILGTYEIQYPFGTETLVLNEDTYEQRFVDKTGKVFTGNGKWTFDSTARQNQGALENAMNICDGFGNFASTTPQQGRHLITFAWHGGTVIPINDDKDFYMRKVK
jgi:hypothetical protein